VSLTEAMEPAIEEPSSSSAVKRSSLRKDGFELFIFSEAGKPIYSFSKCEDAITLMPLCSALINYALKVQSETLLFIKTSDDLVISFTTRSPLVIIVIYDANSNVDPNILVDQVEAQIISILTAKTLQSVFEERPTFDLKRLLYGSEKLIDSLLNLSVHEKKLSWPYVQAFLAVTSTATGTIHSTSNPLLPSRPHRVLIPIVSMPASMRDIIHNTLTSVVLTFSKNIVFSLLFRVVLPNNEKDEPVNENYTENFDEISQDLMNDVSFKLIDVCNHHGKHKVKIADIHIILALLDGSKSQLSSVESLWMPVCMPRFNRDAFLHSYISYLNGMRNCLILFSIDRDDFSNCQKARNGIEEKLDQLLNDASQKSKLYYQMSPLVHPVLLDLQDKLLDPTSSSSRLAELQQQAQIYNSKLELYHARQLQFLWYQTNKQVLWWQRSSRKPPSPALYYVMKKMLRSSLKTLWLKLADETIFLGWHVPTFQLYAQFDNTVTTNEATEVVQRITNWVKKEEDSFTIRDYK